MINSGYFRTFPGTLKVFELILSFIGFMLTILFNKYSNVYFDVSKTYTIIAAIAFGVTLFLVIVNVLGFYDYLKVVLQYQKYFHLVWMMFVLSYASIMLYNGSAYFQLLTGGISGIILAITFLVDGINGFHSDPSLPV